MEKFSLWQATQKSLIEQTLEAYLPAKTAEPATLHQAMHYAVFSGGQRLRPLLCMAAAQACNAVDTASILPVAAALEYLHSYTLVHDDLPAMDNDELRRGKPTVHVVYGEANAILVGDALLTLAFATLGQATLLPDARYQIVDYIRELSQVAGSQGVIGGQAQDLAAEKLEPTPQLLTYIHQYKTAALIVASVRLGGMGAQATPECLDRLAEYGRCFGLAYQIIDDILDRTTDLAVKLTYVKLHGLKNAQRDATQLLHDATQPLDGLPGNVEPLRGMLQLLWAKFHE